MEIFASDKPNRLQRQKNAVTVPQRGKTIQDDSGQAKKIHPLKSNSRRTFQFAPSGCILATGNTAVKKEQLSAAGFHWSRQQKTIYAEPMKALPQSFGLNWH